MQVRYATEADLPAILEIYNDAVLTTTATADYEPQPLEVRAAWYRERAEAGYPVFVAEEDGNVIGWSALNPYKPRIGYRYTAEVSIYVAAEARGRGAGKALLAALIEAGKERGYHSLVGAIDGNNDVSLKLHANFGFVKIGHLRDAYTKFDRWLDTVYVQLLLETNDE
jgi:L-amino acid N-acyltransferase